MIHSNVTSSNLMRNTKNNHGKILIAFKYI